MNKEYKIKLDLNKKLYNKKMTFNQFDENVNDFYIEVTKNNEVVKDLNKSIITLVAIKPDNTVEAQFVEVENGLVYADLKPSMCDLVGNYQTKAMIVLGGEIVTTDTIIYSVNEDKIISRLNEDVVSDERFTLFTDALARLSTIELSEEQRVINEAERILSEENRKTEETKRVEAELIRQHEEADRAKYDATRESNENTRKQNEEARISSENVRLENEANRIEQEANRVKAEQLRKDNYNFMTEDEERRRLEANAHKEAEVLRVQAETNRVNEEAKRRTTEQARVSAENTRVNNENTRKANETTRQTNETHRVEAETQRQNRYNSFIADAEANANDFENYTNTAKAKEEERKANELDRKSQEDRRVSNEVERISNENTRKANEKAREKNETSRQNIFENKVDEVDKKIIELNTTKDNFVSSINTKVDTKISELDNAKSDMTNTVTNKIDEVENRFNALTSKQQQDAEVIDARDGETSLKARLDRDIEKAKQVYVKVEGNNISTDSSSGYAKDVEILGNTVQDASNLADIRSVGDKVEGQELYEIPVLSVGKNLFDDKDMLVNKSINDNGNEIDANGTNTSRYIRIKSNTNYATSTLVWGRLSFYDENKKLLFNNKGSEANNIYVNSQTAKYVRISFDASSTNIQLEEGTVATPYEPYIEDKLTILSPVQLEKVGDVADRIICKDEVWGVEKNIVTKIFNGSEEWIYDSQGSSGENSYGAKVQCPDMPRYSDFNYNDIICDSLPVKNTYEMDIEGCSIGWGNYFFIKLLTSTIGNNSLISFKKWVGNNNVLIKYPTTEPQFIPLPHDQQVKLRTFANKTNISFLTEIEGTIKAQVPKSLGATVNTHTEQINNLNKELDRVKKLEESTVSTVETESDFTTVEATSNGYFEDVKLEGKTLVNLIPASLSFITSNNLAYTSEGITNLNPASIYTLIVIDNNSNKVLDRAYLSDTTGVVNGLISLHKCAKGGTGHPHVYTKDGSLVPDGYMDNVKVILLEGDHTQNPPSYFEGLKSVGDGVDEIVVSSVNSDNTKADKKRLLYYNNETQTWEKPILRQWDSIEKHSDGKYYYYQRSGEVVLNGSEDWKLYSDPNSIECIPFEYVVNDKYNNPNTKALNLVNDKFSVKDADTVYAQDVEGIVDRLNLIRIKIQRSKLSTQDVAGFKQWLQANNVTVVYQLAEEKVYECTSIDLITYANETNYIIESGAIAPKTTLKVHNNISNVVSLLQKKVSLLENNITSYMITQNRLMLVSRYNADTVSFKVDVASFSDTFEYDNDLYELILNNILVGKDNYNREYIENLIRFYWMDFVISDEMYSTLFEIIEEQHNPKVIEKETPLI